MSNTLQTYYLVTGTYKITERETSLYIPAETEGAALERAAVEGISVESIELKQPEFLRWYQFTLKSLLVFMLVSGLFFGWVGKKVMEARKQREVAAWVKENGGYVHYDYEFNTYGGLIQNPQPPVPNWLLKFIGIDNFCNVEIVGFSEVSFLKLDEATNSYNYIEPELTPLQGLVSVKRIRFMSNLPSNHELQKLQTALPNCEITYNIHSFGGWGSYWCKQCNDWHGVSSDPLSPEP